MKTEKKYKLTVRLNEEDYRKLKYQSDNKEFIDLIKKYSIILLILNISIVSLFLLGTYKFYYKETIEIIKNIIRGNEKYWWDKEKNILYISKYKLK